MIAPAAEHQPSFEGWLVARVAGGSGYWLVHDSPTVLLSKGDVLVVADDVKGLLRASQLETFKLQYFTVQPHDLEGLLTVVEWHRIEVARLKPWVPVRFFYASDPIGQKFTRISGLLHTEQLPLRCALLQLWAAATADFTGEGNSSPGDGHKLRHRFWQLLSRMTRMEFCFSAAPELAARINCSERHLRGLFRKEFGVSLHAYQSALRIQMAGFSTPLEAPSSLRASDADVSRLDKSFHLDEAAPCLNPLPASAGRKRLAQETQPRSHRRRQKK